MKVLALVFVIGDNLTSNISFGDVTGGARFVLFSGGFFVGDTDFLLVPCVFFFEVSLFRYVLNSFSTT